MNNEKNNILPRLAIVYIILLLVFVIPIIYTIFHLQFVDEEVKRYAKENSLRWSDVNARRGSIYSSDDKILSTSIPVYDVSIDFGIHKERKPLNIRKHEGDSINYIPMVPDSIFWSGIEELSTKLSELFGDKTPEEYYEKLVKDWTLKNRNAVIHKNVHHDQLKEMKTFPILTRPITIKVNKKVEIKGRDTIITYDTTNIERVKRNLAEPRFRNAIIVRERDIRVYPYNNLARHTIGFEAKTTITKIKNNGKEEKEDSIYYRGLDGFYNSYLEGEKGKRRERRLNKNTWIPIDDNEQKNAINGLDIVSTIDTRLQDLAESSLRKCLIENEADYGCVVLMEVETGYVRAISNLTYTDSAFGYKEINNIACDDLYEPGSTFKTVTAMVLLDNDKCDTSYIVPTGLKQFNPKNKESQIKDVNSSSKDTISMKRSFEISSNVGTCQPVWDFYNTNRNAFKTGIEKILPYKRLNLDLITGGEPMPTIIKDLEPDRNFLNLAYGYSTNLTAMHLLTFYNAIANNGRMVRPIFCSEIREGETTIKKIEPEVIIENICSKSTLNKIHSMLVGVVENGSARRLSKTPYGIAGKTGTSQINYTEKKNSHLKYRASFAGYFPADNPKYSCIVVITNPKKNKQHGGEIAAPVFKDLADRVCGTVLNVDVNPPLVSEIQAPFVTIANREEVENVFNILNFEPQYNEEDVTFWTRGYVDTLNNVIYSNYLPTTGVIPNCKGMTIKDAMYMLEKMGLRVTFEGRGKVVSQSLKPGSGYKKNNHIHLVLNINNNLSLPQLPQQNTDGGTN